MTTYRPSDDRCNLVSLPLLLLQILPYPFQDCAWTVLLQIIHLQASGEFMDASVEIFVNKVQPGMDEGVKGLRKTWECPKDW